MKRYLLAALGVLGLPSCGGGLGPRDESADTPVVSRAQLRNLPGHWAATPATYALLRRRGYQPRSLPLVLRPDSTFAFAALPDCLPLPFGQGGRGKLLGAAGRWQVRRQGRYWEVDMDFKAGKLYPNGVSTNYSVAVVDSTYQLYTYLGDPDEAQVLTWTKSTGGRRRVK